MHLQLESVIYNVFITTLVYVIVRMIIMINKKIENKPRSIT